MLTTLPIKRKVSIVTLALRTIIVFVLLYCSLSFAADTDYLKELSVEAESTSKVSSNSKLDGNSVKKREYMERMLGGSRPSIYKIYKRLDQEHKEQVFNAYVLDKSKPTKRLRHLVKSVLDHSGK